MNDTFPIAVVGELMGHQARSAMLVALLDGRARTAGELALNAEISAQSASGHLSKLLDGGLLKVRSAGRHRYYSVAGSDVAHAIEALGALQRNRAGRLRFARKQAAICTWRGPATTIWLGGSRSNSQLGWKKQECSGRTENSISNLGRTGRVGLQTWGLMWRN